MAGLMASLVAMGLLVTSAAFTDDESVAYALLLVATACLGAGFGLAVPTLNTFTAVFHPATTDRSVLVLNALLGLGTALAPLFVAIFVGLGFWWGLPVLSLGAARRPAPRQCPPAVERGHARRRAAASDRTSASPPASGCTPSSPCCTASARR